METPLLTCCEKNTYLLLQGKLDFYRDYKFYRDSCLGCLICSYRADWVFSLATMKTSQLFISFIIWQQQVKFLSPKTSNVTHLKLDSKLHCNQICAWLRVLLETSSQELCAQCLDNIWSFM